MNAIQMLQDDHDKVRALLAELVSTTARATRRRQQLLDQITMELRIHTTLEEELFYPAFRSAGKKGDDERMYFEAMEEHRAAGDLVLPDLQNTAVDSDQFGGRSKVLKELIEHHADEEESDMFPRARKLMGRARLEELGAVMAQRKRELKESYGTTIRGVGARVVSALTGGIGMGGMNTQGSTRRRSVRGTKRGTAKRNVRATGAKARARSAAGAAARKRKSAR